MIYNETREKDILINDIMYTVTMSKINKKYFTLPNGFYSVKVERKEDGLLFFKECYIEKTFKKAFDMIMIDIEKKLINNNK